MLDPVSAVATAAGITSLGIQVCQGLIFYLRSINGRRQEIADNLREVQILISVFYSLNDILPEIDRRGLTDSLIVRECLKDSEGRLREFQQMLLRLRGPTDIADRRERMKEAGRPLIYPFHEGKLNSLHRSLRRLLENLTMSINIASLYGYKLPLCFSGTDTIPLGNLDCCNTMRSTPSKPPLSAWRQA